ncbi:T9SS type A sorting domain-containing protein [bacterium SCSIO 12741]|nr:T9SS type A sorting domain-containing protein [bacterium SCSIO 12741]
MFKRSLGWLAALALLPGIQSFGQGLVKDYSFTSTKGTYTPLSGGTQVSAIHGDSKMSASISLGFSFTYDGNTYTHVKASSNGFLQLDTTKTSSRTTNDLNGVNEPIIAPLWDDLDGRASNSASAASYTVTGTAPNRVFTMEWLKWEWRYNSTDSVISFQAKLYETSNKIEFIYRPESAPATPSASVGLCGLNTGVGTFLSLNSLGANPTVSSTTEYSSLNSLPDSGRTYAFSPPTCLGVSQMRDTLPGATFMSILFNSSASVGSVYQAEWGTAGFTRGSGNSINGTTTAGSTRINLTGLTEATSYDIYIREVCAPTDTSGWNLYTFSTLYPNPQQNNFVGFNGSNLSTVFPGWREATNWPTPTGTSSSWVSSTTSQQNALGQITAKINLYTTTRDEWLISPRFLALSTDSLKFKAALTNYNNGSTDKMGSDDTVKVLISEDGGLSWTQLMMFDSISAPSNSLQKYSLSLSAYAGKAIQIAFYAQDGPIDDSEDYDFHVTDIFMGTPPTIDMAGIDVRTANGCLTANETVFAIIENKASATIQFASNNTTVGVAISGAGTGTLSTTLSSDSLQPGDTLHVNVGTFNFSTVGNYDLKSYAIVNNDGDLTNDTSSVMTFVQDSTYAMPQEADFAAFTGSNMPSAQPGWREASGANSPSGTSSAWLASNTTQTTALGQKTAKINLYTDSRNEWIISPKMTASATDTLFFKAALTNYNNAAIDSMGSDDSVKVLISDDCGLSWTQVMVFDKNNEPGNSLTEYKYALGSYAGSSIYVAFKAQDGPVDDSEDYDFHITDIFIGTPPTKDFGVVEVIAPSGNQCGSDSTEVIVVVENFGINAQTNVSVSAAISGSFTATLTGTVTSLAPTMLDTISLGWVNTKLGGTMDITAYSSLTGDEDNSNDTLKVTGIGFGAIPNTPSASNINVCSGVDTMLIAGGSTNGFRWYNIKNPDSVIHTGDTLMLNQVSMTDTFEVEGFNFTTDQVGRTTPPSGSFLTGGAGWGLGFNVNSPSVQIDSVTIYPTGSGWVIVEVSDYSGTPLYRADTVFITGGSLNPMRIPVGLTVPSGQYKMTMDYSGITNMGRESAVFPYSSTLGEVEIIGGSTGTGNPTSSNYYWFYDWAITIPQCPSDRQQAIVTILPSPMVNIGSDSSFCAGSNFTYTLDATTPGSSYLWQDNSIGATYAATTPGTYWVDVTGGNGCVTRDSAVIGSYALPTVSFPDPADVCANADSLTLTGAMPAGGMYSGTNVANGKFIPTLAGAGVDTLYYSFTDTNNCMNMDTAHINVDTVPVVMASAIPSLCVGGSPATLTFGSPMGGVYSGNQVSGGAYDPVSVGMDTLGYRFEDSNGCADSTTAVVTVNGLPTVTMGPLSDVCENAPQFNLSGGMPTGGTYMASGINLGGMYDPSQVGAGMDTVVYTYTDGNGCMNSDSTTMTILPSPVVAFALNAFACSNDTMRTLTEGTPIGGTYSGPGVTGTNFNASAAGTGNQQLTYSFMAPNGCSDSATGSITVEAAPTFNFVGELTSCGSSPIIITTDANGMDHAWSDGTNGDSLTTTTSGTVSVTVTDPSTNENCSTTDSVVVNYDAICVGIDERLAGSDVRYFPNPSNGQFSYELKGFSGLDVTVTIVGTNGQEIYRDQWTNVSELHQGQIDLQHVNNGLYFIHLSTSKGMVTHRISIAH